MCVWGEVPKLTCYDLQAVELCAAQAIPPLEIKVSVDCTEHYRWKQTIFKMTKGEEQLIASGMERHKVG